MVLMREPPEVATALAVGAREGAERWGVRGCGASLRGELAERA